MRRMKTYFDPTRTLVCVACFQNKLCFAHSSRRLFIRVIFIRTLTFRIVAEKNPNFDRIANWVHVSVTDE